MKKQLSIKSFALAALLCLASMSQSCTDKEEADVYASRKIDYSMTVSPTKVDLPARNASQEIQVSSNTAWTVSSDVTWAHVSSASGTANGSFTVTLDDNGQTAAREAVITIAYGSDKKSVTLTQAGAKLILSATEVTLAAKNASQEFKITANTTWNLETEAAWVHLSETSGTENGTFTVTLADNKSLQPRQTTIIVNYGSEGQQAISLGQSAADATAFGRAVTSAITRHEAKVSNTFSSMFDVEEYGIVYSATVSTPTIKEDDDRSVISQAVGTAPTSQGTIATTISNLKSATTYYLRFYTCGPLGTEYSDVVTFKTEGQTPDEADHQTPEI